MIPPIRSRHTIGHREYTSYGANAEMLAYLENSGSLSRLMGKDVSWIHAIIRAIASPSYAERVQFGKECVKRIWQMNVPFGPCYLLPILSEFEFDRAFYSGYRDHVTHQLKVLLLGLYLYESCSIIGSLIDNVCADSDGFQKRWVMTALFHDIGYVFEVGDATQNNHATRTIEAVNTYFQNPVAEFIQWRYGPVLLPAELENLRNEVYPKVRHFTCFDDILRTSNGTSLLGCIELYAQKANLGNSNNPLADYLKYARSNRPINPDRPPFIDHGIASSCILLHMYQEAINWSSALSHSASAQKIVKQGCPDLLATYKDFQSFENAVFEAAIAISLHNITPDIWNHDHAYRWEQLELTLNRFHVELKQHPLAGLLILVDCLQEWDRPKFSAPQGAYDWPQDVLSQDLHVVPIENGIGVSYPGDPFALTGNDQSHFVSLQSNIKRIVHWKQNELNVRELSITSVVETLEATKWAKKLLEFDDHMAGLPPPPSLKADQAYEIYRRGRALANNGAWVASAECHEKAAELFVKSKMGEWAARSIGRAAWNDLDLGNDRKALESLERAAKLDLWQGVANYYWAILHIVRGPDKPDVLSKTSKQLMRTIASDNQISAIFGSFLACAPSETMPSFEDCMTTFFQELVAREVSTGWPAWSMSDVGRLYVMRAEALPEVADTLFEAAATAYEEAELSSYAAWYHCKADLVRTWRASSLDSMISLLDKAQDSIVRVVQRPGRKVDPANVTGITISCLSGILRYALTGDRVWLTGFPKKKGEPSIFLPSDLLASLWTLLRASKKIGSTKISPAGRYSMLGTPVRNILWTLIQLERDRLRHSVSDMLKSIRSGG